VRTAVFVLLSLNLAFFAWSTWLAPRQAEVVASPAVNAKRLALATETQTAAAAAKNTGCVTVGPFAAADAAARARQVLTDSGYSSTPREETTTAIDGYYVYLEAPTSETGERNTLARLRRGGITDAAIVGEGAAKRVSLGIFSDEARAAARSESVAKLQFLPQIEAREKSSTSIWLDLALKTGSPPLEGQKFPAGDAELEFRPCPAAAVAAAEGAK
jgi:hypothetical protein